jgi:hypothetical protein
MSKFLRALEKVGLVQVDGGTEEPQPVQSMTDDRPPAAAPSDDVPLSAADLVGPESSRIAESATFDTYYATVATCPYPAEKMLKLLDGLQAMDVNTRKSAVTAMDQADDSWAIDDTVADARAKIAALTAQASALTARIGALEKETDAAIKLLSSQNDDAIAAIRKQMAELDAMLSRQIEKAAAEKADFQAQLQSAREACTRETGRLHGESARLSTIIDIFGTTTLR